MRLYVGRHGPGVSFGIIGTLVMALAYLLFFAIFVVCMLPFIALELIALLGAIGDGLFRAIPTYRQRRARLGPVQWYRKLARSPGSIFRTHGSKPASRQHPAAGRGQTTNTKQSAAALELRNRKRQVAGSAFAELTPEKFTQAVGELFTARGYKDVRWIPGSTVLTAIGDDDRRLVIQCIPFSPGVHEGVAVIRKALPLVAAHGAQQLVVVSYDPFTPQAKKLAAEASVRLLDRNQLVDEAELAGWLQAGTQVPVA